MTSKVVEQSSDVQVDEIKVRRLMKNIVKQEEINSKTHEMIDSAMIRKIVKMIEEEADCY